VVGGAVAGMVVSGASPAQALEFVTNGNFDSDITGWTSSGWNRGTQAAWVTTGNNSASNPANISQTISGLVVGQTYNFSFDYQGGSSTSGIIATLGSTTLASVIINNFVNDFTTFSNSFVASQTSATLNFQGYSEGLFSSISLDNVSLTDAATPVPFDIPGGATIPTVGSLFALGLMRQAKKRLALKKLVVNSGETVV
jgi:hypothetical protein